MNKQKKNTDLGLFCFLLVSFLAIPVTILRSRTFEIGYELASLKENEKALKRKNLELIVQLASSKKEVRENLTIKNKLNFFYPNFYEVEFYEIKNTINELYSINKEKIINKNKL